VKDYEESERIAAKVAADLTWFIQRTSEYQGPQDVNTDSRRELKMAAGAGFTLLPGETVGTIKSERPNSDLVNFRSAMLRAVAGGTGTRYSSIARDYNGTYSAQRQELVEAQRIEAREVLHIPVAIGDARQGRSGGQHDPLGGAVRDADAAHGQHAV